MGSATQPFDSCPDGGRKLLGRVRGANCRREYGLRHQQITGQTSCAYCGISLVDTYDHWLMMAYDHVIPASVCAALSIPVEWIDDISNRVLCCAACNGFKNRYSRTSPMPCPTSLEGFFDLRDMVYQERKEQILQAHERERDFYSARPWERRIDLSKPLPVDRPAYQPGDVLLLEHPVPGINYPTGIFVLRPVVEDQAFLSLVGANKSGIHPLEDIFMIAASDLRAFTDTGEKAVL